MSGGPLERVDVAIVGGGVIGCAAAYALARDGRSVRLFERDALAGQASGAAAGMIAPVAEEHLAQSPGGGALRAGLAAMRALPALCDELRAQSGIDPQWEASGLLRVAGDEAGERQLRSRARELAAHARVEWLEREDALALEPGLAPGIAGALWSSEEGHVSSADLTRAFAAAAQTLGARIECGAPVIAVERDGPRAIGVRTRNEVVHAAETLVCTGAWAGGPGAGLDLPLPALPIVPVRGQILSLRPHGRAAAHARSRVGRAARPIVWGPGAYLVPKRDGSLVVGATVEHVGFDRSTTAAGIAQLLEAAPRLIPSLASAELLSRWAGLRPGSPDGLPAIGRVPGCSGLIVAVGHHRNGVLLAWTTAQWLTGLVSGKALPAEADACRLERFLAPGESLPLPQREP